MTFTKTVAHLLGPAAAVVVVLGLVLTACSAGVTDGDSPPPASATSPATSSAGSSPAGTGSVDPSVSVPDITGLPTGATSGNAPTGAGTSAGTSGAGAAALPAGFPLPPGASTTGVTRDGNEIVGRLAVTDGDQAFQFWKQALPGAGFTVVSADAAAGYGEVRFSGHGCVGDSQIALSGTTAVVQCDLG